MQDGLVRGGKGDRAKAWRVNLVINYNVKESEICIYIYIYNTKSLSYTSETNML